MIGMDSSIGKQPPLIYFARAIDGLDPKEIKTLAEQVGRELAAADMQMVDPYVELPQNVSNCSLDTLRDLVARDLALLKEVNGVLMDLSLVGRSYVGCICELVYASLWRIPVAVYVGDSGIGSRPWLRYHAAHVSKYRSEAVNYLQSRLV